MLFSTSRTHHVLHWAKEDQTGAPVLSVGFPRRIWWETAMVGPSYCINNWGLPTLSFLYVSNNVIVFKPLIISLLQYSVYFWSRHICFSGHLVTPYALGQMHSWAGPRQKLPFFAYNLPQTLLPALKVDVRAKLSLVEPQNDFAKAHK